MNTNTRNSIVIIAVVALLGVLGYAVFAMGWGDDWFASENQNTNNEQNNSFIPEGWNQYTHAQHGLSFFYPPAGEVTIEAGRVKVTYLGPGNTQGSEITEGFTFFVRTEEKDSDTSLETIAEEERERLFEENQDNDIPEPRTMSIGEREVYQFEVESELGTPVTYVVVEGSDTTAFIVSYSAVGDAQAEYESFIETMIRSLEPASHASVYNRVSIALLERDVDDTPDRGCDNVVFVERNVTETSAPLSAALSELFSLERENVEGQFNFIARTNDTLFFDRADISEEGVASIYLTGELSGLIGVCDNPRAAIQIEETALQFSTVDTVQIYLNRVRTDLTADGRGS